MSVKKKKLHRSTRARLENIAGVELICHSQVGEEFYHKLVENYKLEDFIALVKVCSTKEYTIEQTVETINKVFAYYISEEVPMNVEVFNNLLSIYPNVAEAWNFGTLGSDIDLMKIRDKATSIILNMEEGLVANGDGKIVDVGDRRMKAIETYNNIYSKSLNPSSAEDVNDVKQIVFMNTRLLK